MALKITLKPQEKMILGGAVITNGNHAGCQLIIENRVPILREKDILSENYADTPCRRLYFIIQLMYIDEERLAHHQKNYWNLVNEIVNRFEDYNSTIKCKKLIKCDISTPEGLEYAKNKNLFGNICSKLVQNAAEILEQIL